MNPKESETFKERFPAEVVSLKTGYANISKRLIIKYGLIKYDAFPSNILYCI